MDERLRDRLFPTMLDEGIVINAGSGPLTPAEEGVVEYATHRENCPLPDGWSQSRLRDDDPGGSIYCILESGDYVLELRFTGFQTAQRNVPSVDTSLFRKDGARPTELEVLVLRAFLGERWELLSDTVHNHDKEWECNIPPLYGSQRSHKTTVTRPCLWATFVLSPKVPGPTQETTHPTLGVGP